MFARMIRKFLPRLLKPQSPSGIIISHRSSFNEALVSSILSHNGRSSSTKAAFALSSIVTMSIGSQLRYVWCEDKPRKFELPDPKEMSIKQMVDQSCTSMATATVHLVHLTTAAIISTSNLYREAMAVEMLLLNKSLEFINVEFLQEDFNDQLIAARSDIQETQKDLQELLGFMECVEKTANSAAETIFLGGAEYSSFSLSDIIFDAQKRVAEQKVQTQSMEAELRSLQQEVILRSKKPKNEPKSSDSQEPLQVSEP